MGRVENGLGGVFPSSRQDLQNSEVLAQLGKEPDGILAKLAKTDPTLLAFFMSVLSGRFILM